MRTIYREREIIKLSNDVNKVSPTVSDTQQCPVNVYPISPFPF